MDRTVVVHTQAAPSQKLEEEMEALGTPLIDLRLRGPCRTPEAVLEAVRDADIAMCMGEPYTRHVLSNAFRLKAVIRYGVGVDTIDLDAATDHGIVVAHLPDFCTEEVANHALAHLLGCAKKMHYLDHTIRTEGWQQARTALSPMGQIHGETLGLVAFGRIGRAMARRAQALDMHVIAHDPYLSPDVFERAAVEPVPLHELAARSDYVSCHLPLTDETRGMLDVAFFGRMKPTACFVNTGRGAVVVEADLVAALTSGQIAGAGLDVFQSEPIEPHHPFCQMTNVTLTPHTASFADETMSVRRRRIGRNVLAMCRGDLPEHVANPQVLGLGHRRL